MVSTIRYDNTTGFLNICCGGVGLEAGEVFSSRYLADGRAFPQVLVHIDTDPIEAAFVEHRIHIGLDGGMLDALRADPEKFGPEAVTILKKHAQYLDAEDIVNGSRTIRCLTQLSFAYHERKIATSLRKALHDLISRSRIKTVIPVLTSSSGGGAGSALQSLLIHKLHQSRLRRLLTEGLRPHLLHRPISFVAEPYALAHQHEAEHHAKILGNAFAFRLESERLERAGMTKYCFHLGFSNRFGTILSDPHLIGWVLGTSVYELERNWSEFKSRFVDLVDTAALAKGYLGSDLPEHVFGQTNAVPANRITP